MKWNRRGRKKVICQRTWDTFWLFACSRVEMSRFNYRNVQLFTYLQENFQIQSLTRVKFTVFFRQTSLMDGSLTWERLVCSEIFHSCRLKIVPSSCKTIVENPSKLIQNEFSFVKKYSQCINFWKTFFPSRPRASNIGWNEWMRGWKNQSALRESMYVNRYLPSINYFEPENIFTKL